jgi:polyribonucleotide nucleotidyltransferase
MREALAQAKRGRLHILGKMEEVITAGREKISDFAPRFYTVQIPVDKIRDLIGPGGKMIRSIVEQTGVKIDVEDSGLVKVASSDQASAAKALQIIGDLCATAEVGKTYLGKVTRLADFGAFVEIIPGTDGLLHISEVAEHRINDIRDELKEGDQVLVKVLAVEGNRIRLSRKAILKEQRAKMGGGDGAVPADGDGADLESASSSSSDRAPQQERAPVTGSMVIEGGGDFPDEAENEPNFNRDGAPVGAGAPHGDRPRGDRPPGGDRGGRGGRPGGGGGRDRGRGGRGGRPGGGGRDRGRGGPGGGRH